MSSPSSVDAFRDPSIKLFGRDIHGPSESFSSMQQDDGDESIEANKDLLSSNDGSKGLALNEKVFHIQDPLLMEPGSLEANTTMKEDGILHGKNLKKPDKLLPCPRCESLDTKFCYFNNYNVNQPRHFCRKCQRYWTAGGMLRNVPVGAGRRKNKHSSHAQSTSHEKNNIVDTMFVRDDAGDMARHRSSASAMPTTQHNQAGALQAQRRLNPLDAGPILSLDSPSKVGSYTQSFGQESPISTTPGTNAATESVHAFVDSKEGKEGKYLRENVQPVVWSHMGMNQAPKPEKDLSTLPRTRLGGELEEVECESNDDVREPKNPNMPHMALNRGPPHNGAFDQGVPNFWPGVGVPPGGLWAGIPWPLMNPLMWNSPASAGWNNAWKMHYGAENAWNMFYGVENAMPKQQKVEEDHSQPNGCLWAPKTLRIADPVDAARSSIWSTLGLGGPSSTSSPSFGTKPKAFQVKSDEDMVTPKPHSNPAALSRSAAFNENS